MTGLFFGALGFGMISDALGRKNTILLAGFLHFGANLTLYWIDNVWAYTFIRLLCGAFGKGLKFETIKLI